MLTPLELNVVASRWWGRVLRRTDTVRMVNDIYYEHVYVDEKIRREAEKETVKGVGEENENI